MSDIETIRQQALLDLMRVRREQTAEAATYMRLAGEDGVCDCDPDDGCDCATWDRASALQAASTAAMLAQAAAMEAAALTAWWAKT